MNEVLLFSGGLDSFIAYYYLNKPQALFIDIKHKYAQRERRTVKKLHFLMNTDLIIEDEALNLNKWEAEDAIIPLRNIYFAMIASNYASKIWIIGVHGDWTHDKNPEAFHKMSHYLSYFSERKITVDSPFWEMTKTDMVEWYKKQGLSIDNLLATYSCFGGYEKHCGQCPSCFRRWIAFFNNDVHEEYIHNPLDWHMIPTYFERMRSGRYERKRKHEFTRALLKAGYNVPSDLVQDLKEGM